MEISETKNFTLSLDDVKEAVVRYIFEENSISVVPCELSISQVVKTTEIPGNGVFDSYPLDHFNGLKVVYKDE